MCKLQLVPKSPTVIKCTVHRTTVGYYEAGCYKHISVFIF